MSADDRIASLATDISEGRPVDWAAADSSAESDEERATLAELRAFVALLSEGRTLDYRWPVDELPPGSTWGPLRIVSRVGHGQFGTVYRARDARLDRDVALKVLDGLALDPVPASSAIAEARLLARVRHPNVLTVHGAESIEGQIGIWSEFIEGRTLDQIVREHGRLSVPEAIGIGIDLCRALSAVHRAGLLHRDIKAQNVMRETGGRIVLMDFGTGHDPREIPARPGDLSGTPLYVAPEIFGGSSASTASDVYALAVVLFFLLTASYPVPGKHLEDVQRLHRERQRVRLRDVRGDLPPALVAAVERGLAADPAQRFPDADTFERAMRAAQDEVDPGAAGRRQSTSSRWKLVTAVIAVCAPLALGAAWYFRPKPAIPWTRGEIRQLTFVGDVDRFAVSSDGNRIAYLRGSVINGILGESIWVHDIATGKETPVFPSDPKWGFQALTFTPDSQALDVLGQEDGGKEPTPVALYELPLTGGSPRKIATRVNSAVGWSPDGKQMAFVRKEDTTSALVVADRNASNDRIVATLTEPKHFVGLKWPEKPTNRPSWSPDGQKIALAGMYLLEPGSAFIVVVNVTERSMHEVGPFPQPNLQRPMLREVSWLDDRYLLVAINQEPERDSCQVFVVDTLTNQSVAVTSDLASYHGIATDYRSRTVFSDRRSRTSGIWVGPQRGPWTMIIPESSANPTVQAINNRGDLLYTAATRAGSGIWLLRAGRKDPEFVTEGLAAVFLPASDAIVFNTGGKDAGLYRMNIDGSQRNRLVAGFVAMVKATPDGSAVVFKANRTGPEHLWQVSSDGSTRRELLAQRVEGYWFSGDTSYRPTSVETPKVETGRF